MDGKLEIHLRETLCFLTRQVTAQSCSLLLLPALEEGAVLASGIANTVVLTPGLHWAATCLSPRSPAVVVVKLGSGEKKYSNAGFI